MKKSISAKVMADLFNLWPKMTAEERQEKYKEALEKGEKPTPAPKNIITRCEDHENGRIFYANEKGVSRYTVFYIHGGAYEMDFIPLHWTFIEKLVKETNALVIAPEYRLVLVGTYKEAVYPIVPVYEQYCEDHQR